jgi:hypothetical protein
MTEYVIGKSDNILFSRNSYNQTGECIGKIEYDEIVLGLPLSDDLFLIPNNYKKEYADTFYEYMRHKEGARKK